MPEEEESSKTPDNITVGVADEMKREFRWVEFINIVSSVILACVGILALIVYDGQFHVMRHQLTQMQGASTQTNQVICLYQRQLGQLKKQAADTHSLALAAVKEANALARQAIASNTIASATKSASETAKEALKISERAYVIAGAPGANVPAKEVFFPLINDGHIPSGKVVVTVHEATLNLPRIHGPSLRLKPIESHWKQTTIDAIPPTQGTITYTLKIPVPDMVADQLKDGRQQIFIVGDISYGDGFNGDHVQNWKFCEGYRFDSRIKGLDWAPCDWDRYMVPLMSADHYPVDEYKQ